jgi:zinc transporter 5/7
VQVLSGFVNGIFLIFIAFFVMMESLERFMEPPEIKTDRLLLVSTLGFLVSILT